MEYNYLIILDYDCEGRVILIRLTEHDKQVLAEADDERYFIEEFVAEKYQLSESSYDFLFTDKLFVVNDTGGTL